MYYHRLPFFSFYFFILLLFLFSHIFILLSRDTSRSFLPNRLRVSLLSYFLCTKLIPFIIVDTLYLRKVCTFCSIIQLFLPNRLRILSIYKKIFLSQPQKHFRVPRKIFPSPEIIVSLAQISFFYLGHAMMP
jgi:hypothetical protein